MEKDNKTIETNEPTATTNNDYNYYIDEITKLKNSTVGKTEFEKLQAENKRLVETLATRKPVEQEAEKPVPKDLNKLWKEFGQIKQGDCAIWSKALEIRDESIKQEGYDPFTSPDKTLSQNPNEIQAYAQVAEVVKDCLEKAHGNDDVFISNLKAATYDDPNLVMYLNSKNKS